MNADRPSDLRPSDLDLVRAHAEGRLAEPDRAAFARRLAAEPGLAALARAFASVAAVPAPAVSAPRTRFEDLPLDAPPARVVSLRRVAVAATVLLAVGAGVGFLATGGPRTVAAGPVALTAIPETAPTLAVPAVPAALAEYAPTGPDGLRLLASVEDGRAVARLAQRPLVLFVVHPTCPLCRHLERTTFRDAALVGPAAPAVYARLDVTHAPRDFFENLDDLGWPFLVVERPGGERAGAFGATTDAAVLGERLAAALRPALDPAAPAWETVHEVARLLAAADAATEPAARARDLERARELARDSALAPAVEGRRAADAAAARSALEEARTLAAAGGAVAADAAAARLDDAVARFRGTRFEADLRRVRDRVRLDRAFPLLEFPR